MKKWVLKTVAFDRTDKEEMDLYEFAGSLPNFTVITKLWLRSLRDGRGYADPVPFNEFLEQHRTFGLEPVQEYVDSDGGQFL